MKIQQPKTLQEICDEQSETLLKASELIDRQSKMIDKLVEGLQFATKTTGEMSHKIAELTKDHQLVSLIKPVNGWVN